MFNKPVKILFITTLILMFSELFAREDSLINQLQNKYHNISHYRAEFTQTKSVHYISKPLITLGNLEFALGEGLIWQITKPLWVKTLINDKGVYKTTKYQTKQRVNDIQVKIVAEIMTELLTANLDKIESHFEIGLVLIAEDQNTWEIQLLPKKTLIKKTLKLISLMGESQLNESESFEIIGINQIQIMDKSNNLTQIKLTNIKFSSEVLNSETKARFE